MSIQVRKGDCLSVLEDLEGEMFDLVYLDPPFLTQKIQRLRTRDRKQEFSFSDVWASFSEYAEFLHKRLGQVHRVTAPTGSVFVHCDRTASHVVRALLDDIFGSEMFRAEIIWHYRRWSNSQKCLLPAHQNIYFYSKTKQYTFNILYQDYSPSTNIDQILQKRERDVSGKTVYARDEDGVTISNGSKKGVPLSDVWDIPYLNPKAQERTGYPTQKPILLLERIIQLSSNAGDWVLDPFCGSGTTLVAAQLLGRKAFGIDISDDAVKLTQSRLQHPVKSESQVLKKGRDSYQTVSSYALDLLIGLDFVPVHRNSGIDAILREEFGGRPVPIRVQRINETIFEAANALYFASKTKHANIMILVVHTSTNETEIAQKLPPEIILVKTPAQSIRDQILKNQVELSLKAQIEKRQSEINPQKDTGTQMNIMI